MAGGCFHVRKGPRLILPLIKKMCKKFTYKLPYSEKGWNLKKYWADPLDLLGQDDFGLY